MDPIRSQRKLAAFMALFAPGDFEGDAAAGFALREPLPAHPPAGRPGSGRIPMTRRMGGADAYVKRMKEETR